MGKKERIKFFDFARGIAIFFMILQHTVIVFDKSSGSDSGLGRTIILMGTAPAAPVFMFIMGVFFIHRHPNDMSFGIKRGLKLLLLGYVLNAVRFCLPAMTLDKFGLVLEGNTSPVTLFFIVDILQMAGLSLMIMAVARRFTQKTWIWISLPVVVSMVSPVLWGKLTEIPGTALLWGDQDAVFFPLFPWLIYPLVGMIYGRAYLMHPDRGILMKKSFLSGLIMMLTGAIIWRFFPNEDYFVGNYARSGPAIHLIILGFVITWMALCFWIVDRIPDNRIFRVLYFWSRNVIVVYFIQWLLIGWALFLFYKKTQTPEGALLLGFVFVLLTHLLTNAYLYLKRKLEFNRFIR
ncbi:MAG: DUF1624 domain-containing protein [Desulfobacteraceae bacterium]|nr:DUF1624 domain-containing protein [Desulfobacteraceae bacterium]